MSRRRAEADLDAPSAPWLRQVAPADLAEHAALKDSVTNEREELSMRTILMTTAFAALIPGMAAAMPLAPALPQTSAVIQVQGLPGNYRGDPCSPGAPPVRVTIIDGATGQPIETHVPASRFCRGGGGDFQRPSRRFEDDRPVYREPPRRFDDDRRVYRDAPRRFEDDRSVYRTGPRYYDERPVYRERPRYYDDERPVQRERRPPPPGWERDPYTGRDMRILR